MGRPKQHDEATREALLVAAEDLVERGGTGALSVRAVAEEIGSSTRAVYSTFGSKEGLLAALAQRSFDLLRDAIAELPRTNDPARDLVQAALTVFRPMAVQHPSLFQIAFLRAAPDVPLGPEVADAARAGYELLSERVQRLADADLLGGRDAESATSEFNAMCFGMAVTELLSPTRLGPDPEEAWRAAIETLISGFRTPVSRPDLRSGSTSGLASGVLQET
jgi:AcrR family transcriptional regulator